MKEDGACQWTTTRHALLTREKEKRRLIKQSFHSPQNTMKKSSEKQHGVEAYSNFTYQTIKCKSSKATRSNFHPHHVDRSYVGQQSRSAPCFLRSNKYNTNNSLKHTAKINELWDNTKYYRSYFIGKQFPKKSPPFVPKNFGVRSELLRASQDEFSLDYITDLSKRSFRNVFLRSLTRDVLSRNPEERYYCDSSNSNRHAKHTSKKTLQPFTNSESDDVEQFDETKTQDFEAEKNGDIFTCSSTFESDENKDLEAENNGDKCRRSSMFECDESKSLSEKQCSFNSEIQSVEPDTFLEDENSQDDDYFETAPESMENSHERTDDLQEKFDCAHEDINNKIESLQGDIDNFDIAQDLTDNVDIAQGLTDNVDIAQGLTNNFVSAQGVTGNVDIAQGLTDDFDIAQDLTDNFDIEQGVTGKDSSETVHIKKKIEIEQEHTDTSKTIQDNIYNDIENAHGDTECSQL